VSPGSVVRVRATSEPNGQSLSVPERIAERACRSPEACAVVDGSRVTTYEELDRWGDQVARLLASRGVNAGDAVVTCFERSAELVIAELGVMRAGAYYVPLEPRMPYERSRFIVEDTGASVALLGSDCSAALPELSNAVVLTLGDDGEPHYHDRRDGSLVPAIDSGPPAPSLHPLSAAYAVYTSGSTGTPKGVVVPHRALAWFTENVDHAQVGPDDVLGMAASPAFDASTFECWVSLTSGASVTVVPRHALLAAGEVGKELSDRRITVMYMTGALVEHLAAIEPEFAAGLRLLLFGGQVTDPAALQEITRAAPGCLLVQVYGPTETTVWSSSQVVTEGVPAAVPLGTAMPGSTMHLLDARLRTVPAGATGEIYIGGDGVTRGYLGSPALTARRFVPCPFDSGQLYRTGDLAMRDDEGRLLFIGRADNQVKIRGYRVEPEEVAASLRTHPGIGSAIVLAQYTPVAGTELTAYVTYRPVRATEEPSPHQLRDFLSTRLPEYMIPARYIHVDRIPITVTGKVDHEVLRDLSAVPRGER
jgi:amino acid adenylation domain-containing protein